jgi:predicted lipoprotein with Yx(FWY)xxD motif
VAAATSKLGQILVDGQGRTLYTFDPENSGTIVCTATCVPTWPPSLLPSGTTTPRAGPGVTVKLGTIARPDGGTQVTAGNHPLYTFARDSAPGDTNGDGIAGKWHVARPTASSSGATATSSATPGY